MTRSLIAALPALALALGLATAAQAQTPEPGAPPTLSVTGQGTASAEPDIAMIRLGVETQAEAPAAAMEQNTAAVERIVAEIKAAGIGPKDIQTANFSIYPVYDQRRPQPDDMPPEVVGFRVSNEVIAKIRDLDGMGAVLASVVDAGANRINSLSFGLDDDSALRDEARRDAMADARRVAELYAEAASVRLVRILAINDSFAPRPMPQGTRMMRMEAMDSAAVPIERGENTLDASVDVTWEIAPAE